MVQFFQIPLVFSLVTLASSHALSSLNARPASRSHAVRADPTIRTQFFPGPTHRETIEQHVQWVIEHGGPAGNDTSTSSTSSTSATSSASSSSSSTQSNPNTSSTSITSSISISSQSTRSSTSVSGGNGIGGSIGISIGGPIPVSVGAGATLSLPLLPTPKLPTLPMISLPIHLKRDDDDNMISIEKRQQQAQIPFQWCPEFFNQPPKLCSQCGGDSKVKGTCDQILVSGPQTNCPDKSGNYDQCAGYYCKCSDNGGPDNSPKVTSTAVVNGQTGGVVWEPKTLTEYKGLKASTTVTLTEVATKSGDSEVETVAAVVFAGGVAWWAASQFGAAGAVAAIQPPAQRPEGSEEDKKECKKDPKEECEKCGGGDDLGLCKSGTEIGCPCEEEKKCPADTPPTKCSAQECGGDDGHHKCKAEGKLQGCNCCPDEVIYCNSDDCAGDKSLKCHSEDLAGCACSPYYPADADVDQFPMNPDTPAQVTDAANRVFTSVWGADPSKVPGPKSSAPYCTHAGNPNQSRLPKEWCDCGPGYTTHYSVATGTNACPWSPSSTGKVVTFTDPPATTTTTSSAPADPTGEYRIEIYEFMQERDTHLDWTLFRGTENNKLDSGTISFHLPTKDESKASAAGVTGEIPAKDGRAGVTIHITEPTYKDRVNVHFQSLADANPKDAPGKCHSEWQTGNNENPPELATIGYGDTCPGMDPNLYYNTKGCQQDANKLWKKKDAGYERSFKCNFWEF